MPIFRSAVSISHPSMPDDGINTWHVGTGEAGDDVADLLGATVLLSDFYEAIVGPIVAPSVRASHDGIWVNVADGSEISVAGFGHGTGTTGPVLSPALAVCLSWRTGSTSRRRVGRTFLGPLLESLNDDNGTPADTSLLTLLVAAQALVDNNNAAFQGRPGLGVYSRLNESIFQFSGVRVRDQFAVLRSRRD